MPRVGVIDKSIILTQNCSDKMEDAVSKPKDFSKLGYQ